MRKASKNDPGFPDLSDRWEELWTLVDGAYTVVELMNTENSAYNTKWKKEWLHKARELGANPDML